MATSHAVHHRFTNNVNNGETTFIVIKKWSYREVGGEKELHFQIPGKKNYGILQLVLHLIFGWPAYLLTGSTGGIKYGTSNHFGQSNHFQKHYGHQNGLGKYGYRILV